MLIRLKTKLLMVYLAMSASTKSSAEFQSQGLQVFEDKNKVVARGSYIMVHWFLDW